MCKGVRYAFTNINYYVLILKLTILIIDYEKNNIIIITFQYIVLNAISIYTLSH